MDILRRAAYGATALTLAAALGASSEADNGNNTLAGKSADPTAPGGPASTAPARAGGDNEVEAKDNMFEPKSLTAAAGVVNVTVKNTGAAPHTYTNKDLGVDAVVQAGKTAEVKIADAKPGTYKMVCTYHESIGMVGELVVT
jgi:plastocyanin